MSVIIQQQDPDAWAEFQHRYRVYMRKFRWNDVKQLQIEILQYEAELLSRAEAESAAIVETNLEAASASYEKIAELGLSPEGGSQMASASTMQTMRAAGAFTIPEDLKKMLPLLLGFILVVFILLKK